VGEHDRAVGYLQAAVAAGERIGAPTWVARSRLELGRVLLARDRAADHELGLRLLAAAADELGLSPVAGRTSALPGDRVQRPG
jgi:hypothetical protein